MWELICFQGYVTTQIYSSLVKIHNVKGHCGDKQQTNFPEISRKLFNLWTDSKEAWPWMSWVHHYDKSIVGAW